MRSDWNNVERFVDLFMKMDDLHQSDLEKWDLSQKGTFDIAYSAVPRISSDAYWRKL